MALGMTRCMFQDDSAVAEDVVLVRRDDHRRAVLQRRISRRAGGTWRFNSEHRIAVGLPNEPRRAGEGVASAVWSQW